MLSVAVRTKVSLNLDLEVARYLTERAKRETGGNVSVLIERLVRAVELAEGVQSLERWYANHPGYAEDAEIERNAAGFA